MANSYQSSLSRYKRYLESVRSRPLWRATLYLTLSLLLLILLLVTALRPTTVTIAKLISDIQKEKELNAKLDNKIAQIQKAQEAYARVAPRITLLDFGLPADPRFGSLAEALQNMLSQNELTVVSISVDDIKIKPQLPQESGDTASMGVVKFDISAKGNYENLKKFIQRLENWRRLVDIKKIVISKPTKIGAASSGGELLDANISGVAGYVYNEEKQN